MKKKLTVPLKTFCSFFISFFITLCGFSASLKQEFRLEVERSSQVLEQAPISFDRDIYGDLRPLPEAKPLLADIQIFLNSPTTQLLMTQSKSLKIMRDSLFTSLFHLNLKPEVIEKNHPHYAFIDNSYPYEPVYDQPFPKRPTFDFLNEVINFIKAARTLKPSDDTISREILAKIEAFQPFRNFQAELIQRNETTLYRKETSQIRLTPSDLLEHPVDSYIILRARLSQFGEIAPMPEFSDSVNKTLSRLKTDAQIKKISSADPVFKEEVESAIKELEQLSKSGEGTFTQSKYILPYPYRRTLAAIERAVNVFDIRDRIQFPESENWYEVENSWYKKAAGGKISPKLLPLYHFNRYKYQQFGLLANKDVVLFPWAAPLSELDLIKNRPVPLGLIGVNLETQRADRHHNSPKDFWYHDINHIRRMWGYDKKLMKKQGIKRWSQLISELRSRELFVDMLVAQTEPARGASQQEIDMLRLERELIFETFHETALPAARSSLLNDIFRFKAVRQPFERLIQQDNQTELVRTFDGNVKSGADQLTAQFSLDQPTTVRYYWDRAPNYLANVDNKGRWGFHGSVFQHRKDRYYREFYKPENVARAAESLIQKLNFRNSENNLITPSLSQLMTAVRSRDGQPELWNYYALDPKEDDSQYGKELISQRKAPHSWSNELQQAKTIRQGSPHFSPEDIADRVLIDSDKKDILRWMTNDLEKYLNSFDSIFQDKLTRITGQHRQRYIDMKHWLAPLKTRLQQDPQNKELKQKIDRLAKELKLHAMVVKYSNADELIQKIAGSESKILSSNPIDTDLDITNKKGSKVLYIDAWGVPFFNSGTQTSEMAYEGVRKALAEFKKINYDAPISYRKFSELTALFARPEFDDLRRFKLKPFPTLNEQQRFKGERNDAMLAAKNFPDDLFKYTNTMLDVDHLSASFGTREHFVGIVSHLSKIKGDGRIFTGPADFLEHDYFHAFLLSSGAIPGSPKYWKQIHEDVFFRINQEPDIRKRKMMSLVYFHLTHESGYRHLSTAPPNSSKNSSTVGDLESILNDIKEKIMFRYHYDWILETKEFNGDHEKFLNEVFWDISRSFKSNYQQVVSSNKSLVFPSQPKESNGAKIRCIDIFQ